MRAHLAAIALAGAATVLAAAGPHPAAGPEPLPPPAAPAPELSARSQRPLGEAARATAHRFLTAWLRVEQDASDRRAARRLRATATPRLTQRLLRFLPRAPGPRRPPHGRLRHLSLKPSGERMAVASALVPYSDGLLAVVRMRLVRLARRWTVTEFGPVSR